MWKAKWCLRRPYEQLKREKPKEKGNDTPN